MFDHKIIFTGPVGAGKTTAIHTYSDIEPVITEVRASDDVKNMKENTTVALDYGMVMLDDETKIHLYGTPGQERFDFMWDILGKGSHGLVVLVDHNDSNPIEKMKFYLEKFASVVNTAPVVVGVNKFSPNASHGLQISDYVGALPPSRYPIDVHPVDIRREADVRLLIMTLLFNGVQAQ